MRVQCNQCGRETNHAVRSSHAETREDFVPEAGDGGIGFEEKETIEIVQCLGCNDVAVRHVFEHEGHGTFVRIYPARISRRMPRWKRQLPDGVRNMVEEVYRALQSDSPRLATIGARTILDLVLLDKVGDVGSFVEKLRALEATGHVGRNNREFVAAALETGSAAAHRGVAPSLGDLNLVMDIVESLLESVYVLGEAAQRLRETTPVRPVRAKNR